MSLMKKHRPPLRSAHYSFGRFTDDTFHITHDAGLFSICSTTLFELSRREEPVTVIRGEESFQYFGQSSSENPWDFFFQQPLARARVRYSPKNVFARRLRHHWDYSTLRLKDARPYLRRYFSPSPAVLKTMADLVTRHKIVPRQTIVVNYRGTDKHKELEVEQPEVFFREVLAILAKNPRYRVLVQTDQQQVRDYLVSEIGDRAFFLPELPVTLSSTVIHSQLPADEQIRFGQHMLATVLIMAQSRFLVTHTGNVALWTVLYRGNTTRVTQLGRGSPRSAPTAN